MLKTGAWTMVSDAKGVLSVYKLLKIDWPNATVSLLMYSRYQNFEELGTDDYSIAQYLGNIADAKRAGREVTHISGKTAKDLLKFLQRKTK